MLRINLYRFLTRIFVIPCTGETLLASQYSIKLCTPAYKFISKIHHLLNARVSNMPSCYALTNRRYFQPTTVA
jgi:hypothetical protein